MDPFVPTVIEGIPRYKAIEIAIQIKPIYG